MVTSTKDDVDTLINSAVKLRGPINSCIIVVYNSYGIMLASFEPEVLKGFCHRLVKINIYGENVLKAYNSFEFDISSNTKFYVREGYIFKPKVLHGDENG